MQETLSATTEDVSSKKRGRKTVNVNYFDVREENAVRNYLLAETSEEKNKIYNEFLNYIVKIWILMKSIVILILS
jgi:hypothetical protein